MVRQDRKRFCSISPISLLITSLFASAQQILDFRVDFEEPAQLVAQAFKNPLNSRASSAEQSPRNTCLIEKDTVRHIA
jgi:hypothetical protein